MTDDLVKRLREFDTKKMDAWAICDDAANIARAALAGEKKGV